MQQVGSYEVLRVLARGGMAVVYLARQPALDREVALKRLQLESEDPTVAQRFVREARIAAGLDHPNVVTLFDFFEDDGVPYIAVEYVGDGALRRLVGRLELPQVLGVIEGILAGLSHAEARGIVHRDLKPAGGFRIEGAYGKRIFSADMDRDGYDDLVVGAPAADPGPQGSGVAQIVFGSARGLGGDPRQVVRPDESMVHFGTPLRAGDINGDREHRPRGGRAGHARVRHPRSRFLLSRKPHRPEELRRAQRARQPGRVRARRGRRQRRRLRRHRPGDAVVERFDGAAGGEVRVWLGSRHGPAGRPIVIDQRPVRVPGEDEFGDGFGMTVGAGDLDRDGYGDIAIGAPGEDLPVDGRTVVDAGAVTVIRGGRSGAARSTHASFARTQGVRGDPTAGEALGASLTIMDITGNRRPS